MRSTRQGVLRGGGVVFLGKLFTYGARLVMALIMARILGADQYGLYNLAISTAILVASFAALGMDTAVVRYLSAAAAHGDVPGIRGTLRTGIGLPTTVAMAAGAIMFVLAEPIASDLLQQPDVSDLLRVSAALVPLTVAARQLAAALQGLKHIELGVIAEQFVQPSVRLALLLLLAAFGLTAWDATFATVFAAAVATLTLTVFLGARVRHLGRGPAAHRIREMVTFSLPVYFSNFVTTFGNQIQIVLLGIMGTLSAVGIFAIATQVNLIATLFHSSIVAATMPLFAEFDARGQRAAMEGTYRMTSRWTFALNLPIFLVVLMFPSTLLGIFGEDFEAGASALVILALAGLVNAATGTSGALLDMSGHTRVKLVNAVVGVAASVVLSVLLIPPLGLVGAALAVLGSTSAVNVLRIVQVRHLTGLSPYDRSFLAPIAAGAASLVACLGAMALASFAPTALQSIVAATALVATYGVVLMKLVVSGEDRAFLRQVAGRASRRRRPAERGDTEEGADG